jgi:Rha family phage regulatory protein
MNELVFIENGKVLTNSLIVAEAFNKEHRRVMQDIRNLECSASFRAHNFVPSNYLSAQNKDMPMFLMNKKGFTLLAMSYTGKRAMEFKEAYIEKFEQMEKKLLPQPKSQAELIAMMAQNNVEHERRLSVVEEKQDNITGILSLTNNDWRNKVNAILNGIALKLGGGQYYSEIKNESYQLLEDRAGCSISIRLNNRKAKMALRGSSKSAINKTTALDIIAEDKKLIAVYITVVKELAVKYQLNITKHHLEEELEALSL